MKKNRTQLNKKLHGKVQNSIKKLEEEVQNSSK